MANDLRRDTLKKLSKKDKNPLIPLRVEYSEKHKLLSGYINKLVNVPRIYPNHLPTQASYRWSTTKPPITNFPRACINPECPQNEHEWTNDCWSMRDIILADEGEILVTWDHDNIEGRIHDLVVQDISNLEAHSQGYDLHTITCCDMFNYPYPQDKRNPHSSVIDTEWRANLNWQGKDTRQRVLAKNFNHGSKYTLTPSFVHKIQGIENYGVTYKELTQLAKQYITSKGEIWDRKVVIVKKIQKDKIARNLFGARRLFYDSSAETGREGFSHMISGTASHYNNKTIILLEEAFGDSMRFLHNAHDGDKIAIKKDSLPTKNELSSIIERVIEYQGLSVKLTAGIKIYN